MMLLAGVVNAMKIGGATDGLIDVVADRHTWTLLNSAHVIPRTLQCVFNLSVAIYLFSRNLLPVDMPQMLS